MTAPSRAPSTYREVIRLAYPVVFSTLAGTLMGLTDTLFMGWVSTAAQGGVGLGAILAWTCTCFFVGTLSVINTFAAQYFGAGEEPRCGAVVWRGLVLSVGFAVLVVALASQVPRLVSLFGAPPEVSSIASAYALVRVLGVPVVMVETCITSFMRGIGDTRTPMKVSFATVALNVPLNFWLIFGGLGVPALGPVGAAYATIASQAAGLVALVVVFLRAGTRRRYHTWPPPALRARELAPLLWIGLPIGVSWLLEMVTWTIFSAVTSTMGKAPLAAHNIVLQVIHLSFMPGVAISVAATTLVGQGIGAQDPASAERHGLAALRLAMVYMTLMGIVFLLFGRGIATAFTRDPEVIQIAGRLFLLAAAFQMFDAMGMVSGGILRGAGDTRFPMVVSVLFSWAVFLPLVWLLGVRLRLGVAGSWVGATIYIIGLGLALLWRVRSGRWKSCSVQERSEPLAPTAVRQI